MLVDLETTAENPFADRRFDVCICGAGVAGITLATRLPRSLRILLLEAGGLEFSERSQSFYSGGNVGHVYYPLDKTRLRYLGGSSGHWGGMCRPLDAHDFEPREFLEPSGWPIAKTDLDPYTDEARSILDIPATPSSHADAIWGDTFASLAGIEEIEFWWSRRTRFGDKYRDPIAKSENIECHLNANLTDLSLSESGMRVANATVGDYAGRSFRVEADVFILATGGIENARLLQNFDRQQKKGLGNDHGNVGRYFADHPHYVVGKFLLEDPVAARVVDVDRSDLWSARYLAPSPEFLGRHRCLNFGLRVTLDSNRPRHASFESKLAGALSAAPAPGSGEAAGAGPIDGTLVVASEQALNPASRVLLSEEVDRFGLRRPILDWRLSPLDKHTMRSATLRFGEQLARRSIGRLRVADWLLADDDGFPGFEAGEVVSHHHMCTTRMSDSPRDGVVDADQKVFGIDNLYVAGSSSFGTTGHANPTFTIVQTSLRLADHLASRGR